MRLGFTSSVLLWFPAKLGEPVNLSARTTAEKNKMLSYNSQANLFLKTQAAPNFTRCDPNLGPRQIPRLKNRLICSSGLLPRMMLLWRNAFPRSAKELESEKARGDAFTWKISLEARGGALSSMHSFLKVCFVRLLQK